MVPRKSSWFGGLRAIGKTPKEAHELYQKFKDLENAGAFAVEGEVIRENVMEEISNRTNMVTISMGSGRKTDVIYLIMEDICGETAKPPRHAKAYGNLLGLKNQIETESLFCGPITTRGRALSVAVGLASGAGAGAGPGLVQA